MTTVRNHHFDNIKALLIFLVVFGHLIEPLRDIPLFKITYFIIYSFHMPLFIFLAGYFVRPTTKGLKKTAISLLKFEVIYAITYLILFTPSPSGAKSFNLVEAIGYGLQPIWVLWFLLSLIFWRFLLIAYEKHPVASIVIIGIIIGFNFIPFNFRILSLGRTFTFFPYYLLGYLAKKHNFDFKRIELHHTLVLYFGGLVGIFWMMYVVSVNSELLYGATSLVTTGGNLLAVSVFKLISYLIAIAASIIIINLVPKRELVISKIGTQTLPIFLWHPVVIWILLRINFFDQLRTFSNISIFIILTILTALITLFLKDRRV